MTQKRLIASVVLACALYVGCIVQAFAQPTCSIATTTPNAARDEARLSWTAPTQNTDGTPVGSPITYRVYRSGSATGTFAVQCQTNAVSASLMSQPVGAQFYRVTASVAGVESGPSNVVSKTIVAPTPNPPGNLTLLEQLVAWIRSIVSRWFG